MVFVHGLRGNPQTTWTKKRSSAGTAQSSVTASKLRWFGWKSSRANLRISNSQNNPPTNTPESTSAPLPSQATSAGSDPTGDPTLPTTGLAALSSDSREFCWPKDDLPKRLPNVQILLYGYEADVIGPFQAKSQNTITTHGNNFLIALGRKLPQNIPVIFVAHSLGGILVKDVLSLSKSHTQHKYRSIHSNTRRVVFMGTPHRGSEVAGLAAILANITKAVLQNPNKKLLRGLDRGSEVLDRIHTSFMQLLVKPDFDIHCFQEDRGVAWVPGLTGLVVDYQSSKTGSPHETFETIAANHMDMVAYSGPENDNYRQVSNALVSFVDEIRRQPNIHEILSALGLLTAYLPQYPYRDAKAADRIDSRDLDWFFESLEFNQWSSHDSELLWLSGTPKSGKTMLSFCLWDRLKRNWTYTNTGDIAIFFCLPPSDSRATANNQTAQVLSTIVRQLLHSNQKRLELVVQQCPMPELLRQRISTSPSQLLLNELWKILSASVIAVPSHPVIIIIDGIDELRTEEARQIFLQNLLQLQSEVKSKGVRGFKIFITSKPFNDIRKTFTGVFNIEKDKERQQCLQTLKFDKFSARRDKVEQAHVKTGAWLGDDDGYTSWSSSDSSGLLLIRGKPGSGKSTLAKFILNSMKSKYGLTENDSRENAKAKKDVLIADFFYSFRGGRTGTSHRLMLQSLLYQLLSQDERLFPLFRDLFRARRPDGIQVHWQHEDLSEIFSSLVSLKTRQKIYILLDAMDESKERGRPEILRLLMKLCSSESDCAIKGLIATRPLPPGEIDEQSKNCYVISLQERNRKDIENFITSGLQAIKNDSDLLSYDFGFIKDYIMQNAGGVFLWVALVFRELIGLIREGCSQDRLEKCLEMLPIQLEDMYSSIVRRLLDRPKHHIEDSVKEGIKMLTWATFAPRELTTEEFRDAIAVPSDPAPFNPSSNFLDRTRAKELDRQIGAHCGPFLEIRGSVVQLLHLTVRDFLLQKDKAAASFHMDVVRGDAEISSVCIRYLRLLSLRPSAQEIGNWNQTDYDEFVKWLADYPLLDYVVSFLQHHIKSLEEGSPVYNELSLFLQTLQKDKAIFCLFESWTELLEGQGVTGCQLDMEPGQFRIKTLIAAARSGYAEVVKALKKLHTEINGRDKESGIFAILAAANNGHEAVVRLLIERGADVNAQAGWGDGRTALHYAAEQGHEAVVQILIEYKADINAKDGWRDGGTALHYAAGRGHEAVVQILIECGANVNAKDGWRDGRTVLHYAAGRGHEAVVRLLIERGANVNAQAGHRDGRTVLHYAAGRGHEGVVRLLIDYGADVNAQDYWGDGRTVLHYAAEQGHEAVVQLLVKYGADVNVKDGWGDGRTALHYAADQGYEAIVRLLVEYKADINTKDWRGGGRTALQHAVKRGHEAVVRLLKSREAS